MAALFHLQGTATWQTAAASRRHVRSYPREEPKKAGLWCQARRGVFGRVGACAGRAVRAQALDGSGTEHIVLLRFWSRERESSFSVFAGFQQGKWQGRLWCSRDICFGRTVHHWMRGRLFFTEIVWVWLSFRAILVSCRQRGQTAYYLPSCYHVHHPRSKLSSSVLEDLRATHGKRRGVLAHHFPAACWGSWLLWSFYVCCNHLCVKS